MNTSQAPMEIKNKSAPVYRKTKLDSANIQYSDYMCSLTAEVRRLNLISAEDVRRLQSQLSALCKSVGFQPKSILFCIDACLLTLASCEEALKMLLEKELWEIYSEGQKQLKLYVCESAGLIAKIRHTKIIFDHQCYNYTVDTALLDILKRYDPENSAHRMNIHQGLYPIASGQIPKRSIYFFHHYLLCLYQENGFCRSYEIEEIDRLYAIYRKRRKSFYEESSSNLYRLTLINAILSEYLCKEPGSLVLIEDECEIVQSLLGALDEGNRMLYLSNTAAKLLGGNTEYNIRTARRILPALSAAIKEGTLKRFAITEL